MNDDTVPKQCVQPLRPSRQIKVIVVGSDFQVWKVEDVRLLRSQCRIWGQSNMCGMECRARRFDLIQERIDQQKAKQKKREKREAIAAGTYVEVYDPFKNKKGKMQAERLAETLVIEDEEITDGGLEIDKIYMPLTLRLGEVYALAKAGWIDVSEAPTIGDVNDAQTRVLQCYTTELDALKERLEMKSKLEEKRRKRKLENAELKRQRRLERRKLKKQKKDEKIASAHVHDPIESQPNVISESQQKNEVVQGNNEIEDAKSVKSSEQVEPQPISKKTHITGKEDNERNKNVQSSDAQQQTREDMIAAMLKQLPSGTSAELVAKHLPDYALQFCLLQSIPPYSIDTEPEVWSGDRVLEKIEQIISVRGERCRRRCAVVRDLWSRGYYISDGPRFGCDFLAYAGPPSQFHSAFMVWVSSPQDVLFGQHWSALGRVATASKKMVLLAMPKPLHPNPQTNDYHTIAYLSYKWNGHLSKVNRGGGENHKSIHALGSRKRRKL